MSRVFLLSPAFCGGRRATMLRRPDSAAPLAARLRDGSLTLGEAFAFLSGLYFRGKLAYATAFGEALIITPSRGLMDPRATVDEGLLREFSEVDVASDNPTYRAPLDRDAADLRARLHDETTVVLLGSVATGKYVDALTPWFGGRLAFPIDFVGRGDMSRGGLLLRHARSGEELPYGALSAGHRPRGPRPARLTPA